MENSMGRRPASTAAPTARPSAAVTKRRRDGNRPGAGVKFRCAGWLIGSGSDGTSSFLVRPVFLPDVFSRVRQESRTYQKARLLFGLDRVGRRLRRLRRQGGARASARRAWLGQHARLDDQGDRVALLDDF